MIRTGDAKTMTVQLIMAVRLIIVGWDKQLKIKSWIKFGKTVTKIFEVLNNNELFLDHNLDVSKTIHTFNMIMKFVPDCFSLNLFYSSQENECDIVFLSLLKFKKVLFKLESDIPILLRNN